MKKDIIKNEILDRLIREEGLLSTSPGFTERVMQSVEAGIKQAGVPYPGSKYKPLIGRKTWMFIGGIVAAIILVSIGASSAVGGVQPAFLTRIMTAARSVPAPHISIELDTGAILLTTGILAIVSMFLFLDLFLNRKLTAR